MHTLGGRYRLEEQLGAGGMSVVWRAYDTVLGRTVAVKLLAAELAADDAASERIRAEAKAVARLAHPNIGTVYDFGESPGADGRQVPYVVMELLDGETLDERLDSGPLPWREALTVCAEVAAGLAAAHARGIVHQDIKTANVILTPTGAKIVDFGIALSDPAPIAQEDDPMLGTLRYAAPERLLGGLVGPAADVYALGLVLYRCLTGDLPWRSTSSEQIASNHCYVMPRPLAPIDGLPADVPALIARCLAKRPDDRPSSREVGRQLAAGSAIHSGAELRRAVPVSPVLLTRRRPVRIAAAALGVLAAAVFVVAFAGRGAHDGGPAFADAPTGAPGLGPAGYACRVWYSADGGTVKLTVENTGDAMFANWTLAFTVTGNDRFAAGPEAVLAQSGSKVTVRGSGDLPAGRWTTVQIVRTGPPTGSPASGFAVNGTTCAAITGSGLLPTPSGIPIDPPPRGTPPPGGFPPGSTVPPETSGPPGTTPPGSTPSPPTTGPPPSTGPPHTGPPTTVPTPKGSRPGSCRTPALHAYPPPISCPPIP